MRKISLVIAMLTFAACGDEGSDGFYSDEELFGAYGKGEGDTVDVEAIRNLNMGPFSAVEIKGILEQDEKVADYLAKHPERRDELLKALMSLDQREGFDLRGFFYGTGFSGGIGGGAQSIETRLFFKTPQGSTASHKANIDLGKFGVFAGLEFNMTLGFICAPAPRITLNDVDHSQFKGAGIEGGWWYIPVHASASYLAGEDFDLALLSIGVGWEMGITVQWGTITLDQNASPELWSSGT